MLIYSRRKHFFVIVIRRFLHPISFSGTNILRLSFFRRFYSLFLIPRSRWRDSGNFEILFFLIFMSSKHLHNKLPVFRSSIQVNIAYAWFKVLVIWLGRKRNCHTNLLIFIYFVVVKSTHVFIFIQTFHLFNHVESFLNTSFSSKWWGNTANDFKVALESNCDLFVQQYFQSNLVELFPKRFRYWSRIRM